MQINWINVGLAFQWSYNYIYDYYNFISITTKSWLFILKLNENLWGKLTK